MFGNNTATGKIEAVDYFCLCNGTHSGRNCTEEFDICGRNPCGPETVPSSWGGHYYEGECPQIEGATTVNFTMTPAWTLPVKTAARVCTTPPETESVSTCSAIILPRERLRLLTTSVGVMEHTVAETALKNSTFVVGILAARKLFLHLRGALL